MCRGNKGASYVEILLALMLFVVAGVGIIGSHLAMSNLSEYATKHMRAISDLQALAEHIGSTTFQNLTTVFPGGIVNGGSGNPYGTLIGGYTLPGEQITVTYPAQTSDRLDIVLTLNWTYRGRALNDVFSTMRAR